MAIAGNMEVPEQLENIFELVGLSDSRTVYIYSLYLEGFSSFIKSLGDI